MESRQLGVTPFLLPLMAHQIISTQAATATVKAL